MKGRIALVTGPTVTGYQENIVQRGGLGILVVGEPTIKYSYIAQQFAQTIPMLVVSETTANELLAPSGKTVTQVRDAVALLTDWPQYSTLPFRKIAATMNTPIIFDGRNCLHRDVMRENGFQYYPMGRPAVENKLRLKTKV